jgi:tight adherence protein C
MMFSRLPTLLELSLFFGFSTLTAVVLHYRWRPERKTVLRFRELFPTTAGKGRSEPWTKLFSDGMSRWLLSTPWAQLSELLLTDAAARTRLQTRLLRAGYYGPAGLANVCAVKFLAMTLAPGAALLGAVLGVWSFHRGLLVAGMIACLGMLAPGLWLGERMRRRHATLRRSLPDLLDLTTACLDGGIAIEAALQRVTDELALTHPLLCDELRIVRSEIDVGSAVDVAFGHFADRTDLEELRSLAAFVQQSQRYGTTMSDALGELSDMLRAGREHRADELAHKAAVKVLLPTMFFIFPAIFVVLVGPAAIQLQKGFAPRAPRPTVMKYR